MSTALTALGKESGSPVSGLDSCEAHNSLSANIDDETGDGGAVDRKVSVNSISTVPNGGLRAWLVVLGSFFLFFNCW